MFLSHLTGHLVAKQPQSQVAPGQQSMAAATWKSSSPQEPQQPWEIGEVSCFGHKDICPRDTDWDKLVPDHILTGDVELDGSASHQLQP